MPRAVQAQASPAFSVGKVWVGTLSLQHSEWNMLGVKICQEAATLAGKGRLCPDPYSARAKKVPIYMVQGFLCVSIDRDFSLARFKS